MSPSPVPQIERRRAPRFSATRAVELGECVGTTRDFSFSGVGVEGAGAQVSAGEIVQFTILIFDHEDDDLYALSCIGRVVRVEHQLATTFMAATIESFWVERRELTVH